MKLWSNSPVFIWPLLGAALVTAVVWLLLHDPKESVQEQVAAVVEPQAAKQESLATSIDSIAMIVNTVLAESLHVPRLAEGQEPTAAYWDAKLTEIDKQVRLAVALLQAATYQQREIVRHQRIILCRDPSARSLSVCNEP